MSKKILEIDEFKKIDVDFTYENRKELFYILFDLRKVHTRILNLFREIEEKEKEKLKEISNGNMDN